MVAIKKVTYLIPVLFLLVFLSSCETNLSVVNLDNEVVVTLDDFKQDGFSTVDDAKFSIILNDSTVTALQGATLDKSRSSVVFDNGRDAKVYCVNGEAGSGAVGSLYSFSTREVSGNKIVGFEIVNNVLTVHTNLTSTISHVFHPERCTVYGGVSIDAGLVFDKSSVTTPAVVQMPNEPPLANNLPVSGGVVIFFIALIGFFFLWRKR